MKYFYVSSFSCMLEWFLCNEHEGNCWKLINRLAYNCPYWTLQISFKVSHQNWVIQYINTISASFSCFLCCQLLCLWLSIDVTKHSDLKGYIEWVLTKTLICKVEQISTNQNNYRNTSEHLTSVKSVFVRGILKDPEFKSCVLPKQFWSHAEKYSNGILKQMSFSDVIAFPFSYFKKLNFFLLLVVGYGTVVLYLPRSVKHKPYRNQGYLVLMGSYIGVEHI